ncbi:transcription factor grauzone-like [Aedes albopictus]|uniref:C2H2-type domain-containing protein n=1 Tax=Aedes albopictus TaxID=7160 RepID=A0ABM2A3H8_AEDAL|nr:transcription factor grauzone-like [Aedes albopictus]
MSATADCFMCGGKTEKFRLMSQPWPQQSNRESELGIGYIVCQHFWFEEDVLRTGAICEPCWHKVDQFHRYYQRVKNHHNNVLDPMPIFIKQEEIEIETPEAFVHQESADGQVKQEPSLGGKGEVDIVEEPDGETSSKPKLRRFRITAKQKERDDFIQQHKPYHCDDCPELKFDSFSASLRHAFVAHDRSYVTCCNMQFNRRNILFQHVQSAINPEAFKCEICGKAYRLHYIYVRHKLEVHPTEDQLKFKCDRCPKRFSYEVYLKRHMSRHVALESESAKCEICARCFGSKLTLQDHIEAVHKKTHNYICEICSKSFFRLQALQHHRMTHDFRGEELKRQCPICKRWQKNPRSWKKHMGRHGAGSRKCDQCGHVAVNVASLKEHIERRHVRNQKYVCDLCGKEYSRPVTLKEHIANAHGGEPLYQCRFCDKKFFSNATMYGHRKKAHPKELEEYFRTKYDEKDETEGDDEGKV